MVRPEHGGNGRAALPVASVVVTPGSPRETGQITFAFGGRFTQPRSLMWSMMSAMRGREAELRADARPGPFDLGSMQGPL